MKPSFLQSQRTLLNLRPLVVGTLTSAGSISSQIARAKDSQIDMVELRLDSFPNVLGPFQRVQEFGRNILRQIKTKTGLPVLLTLRSSDETGVKPRGLKMKDSKRAEILARLLPSVQMIDVEIRHADFARRMTVLGHIHNVNVIHSAHDFSTPGKLPALRQLSERSLKLKGDIFKVAVTPHANDDLEKFMRWGLGLRNPHRVLIGMGAVGAISRVVGFSFGSIMTYGHLGNAAAPGQLPAAQLSRTIRNVYSAH